MESGVIAGKRTLEQALMSCLRQRGSFKAGFLSREGLSDDEMFIWGSSLEGRLVAFEVRFRGAQHLLGMNNQDKEHRWFRSEIRNASSEIGCLLLEHRGRLCELARFAELYGEDLLDGSAAIGKACDGFLAAKLKKLVEQLSGTLAAGESASAEWKGGTKRLEIKLRRGRAARDLSWDYPTDLAAGTLGARFESTVRLWRKIEKAASQALSKTSSWPSEKEMVSLEEARAQHLMDGFFKGLAEQDRATLKQHGSKAISQCLARI